MQEVLTNPSFQNLPHFEQVYYELRLDDSADIRKPGFIVKQTRFQWSEIDAQMMFDEYEFEEYKTLEEARERYRARRTALKQVGFTFSDMDLF
jgi:hypothetical protein